MRTARRRGLKTMSWGSSLQKLGAELGDETDPGLLKEAAVGKLGLNRLSRKCPGLGAFRRRGSVRRRNPRYPGRLVAFGARFGAWGSRFSG